MSESEAVIEFVMNESYFREFHEEWIAVRGASWRLDSMMVRLFVVAGIAVVIAALVANRHELLYLAGGLLLIALFEGWKRVRRKSVWLNHCKTVPWYGKTMRIVLRGGDLFQENAFEGDPRFHRTGAILVTPNGYLVRYEAPERIDVPSRAISDVDASVYVPHRAITPAMSKADFTQRISLR
jgi:hypothetical protein